MSTVLARVVESAQIVQPRWKDKSTQYLEVLIEQIAEGDAILRTLLPVEQSARSKIEQALNPLKKQRAEIMRSLAYKRLSLEPLTWRDKQDFPALVVFDLAYPVFVLNNSDTWGDTAYFAAEAKIVSRNRLTDRGLPAQKVLPAPMRKCFEDMKWKLPHGQAYCIFDGIIPVEVKRKIAEAKEIFDDIFIIAEPKNWIAPVIDPDPLIVGWDGESLWLIAIFDATPVEEAMAFTVPGALKS